MAKCGANKLLAVMPARDDTGRSSDNRHPGSSAGSAGAILPRGGGSDEPAAGR
jgi:hypothetical protein